MKFSNGFLILVFWLVLMLAMVLATIGGMWLERDFMIESCTTTNTIVIDDRTFMCYELLPAVAEPLPVVPIKT